jgi:hypothetical protein
LEDASAKRGTQNAESGTDEAANNPKSKIQNSAFAAFLRFSDWLHATLRRTHQIALQTVAQALFDFLSVENHADPAAVAAALQADWSRTRGREALQLRGMPVAPAPLKPAALRTARRQARHTQVV